MKNTMKKPVNIPVSKLRPFAGHPFKVKDDEEMNTLIESVQKTGILSPLIVRPIENTDEYEVISGRRRPAFRFEKSDCAYRDGKDRLIPGYHSGFIYYAIYQHRITVVTGTNRYIVYGFPVID